ncbi:unnamed protein product [Rhizophagus irregularis]|nr:unnamed protein product [Rhizophagus irregularis]
MSDVVKDFNTEELIDYLGRKNLKLDKDDIKILRQWGRYNEYQQFTPVFEEINDDDKALNEDIILKLSNVETMTDANEATRYWICAESGAT